MKRRGFEMCARLLNGAVLAFALAAPALAQPAATFGSPPSGEVPIFFDDQHVYATPDTIDRGRTLAALVKGQTILLPLRAMFEAMGATVSWDGATKTATVSKSGAEIKVTLGRPVVSIDGEEHPLDVPPRLYRGAVVVPVRVISEALGAYVQWVPEKRAVVIRYVAAPVPTPPAPTPAPTAVPTPAPTLPPVVATPAPTAAPSATPQPPAQRQNEFFIAADYLVSPKIYNELSPGNAVSNGSFAIQGAAELFGSTKVLLETDFRRYQYAHVANQTSAGCIPLAVGCTTLNPNGQYQTGTCPNASDPGCVTALGPANIRAQTGTSQWYVTNLLAQEPDFDVHVGLKVFDPRVYVGAGYYRKYYNYLGYPTIGGFGAGASKLPDLEQAVSLYGSVWYYPSVTGTYTYPTSASLGPYSGTKIQLGYSVLKYSVGATINVGLGFFLKAGWTGESATTKTNAPVNTSLSSPFAGGGFHF